MSRRTPLLLVVTLLVSSAGLSMVPRLARAQTDQEEHARLLAEFTARPTVTTGCSLAEVERRLGMLDAAAARLDAMLERARGNTRVLPATVSACRFNRARLHEERGELREAYRLLASALETPNEARRRVVEERLVQVGARLAAEAGCAALGSRFSAEALLRFADDATLRRCVQASRRARPFCARIAGADMPDLEGRYGVRRVDPDTRVYADEGYLLVISGSGARASGYECRLPETGEQLGDVRALMVGRQRLLLVTTLTRVSYACDDCEEGEDCRCADESEVLYVLGPRGELLLALVASGVERQSMAAWPEDADELRDATSVTAAVEGSVLVLNGRRLRLVRGALVPAP